MIRDAISKHNELEVLNANNEQHSRFKLLPSNESSE